MNVKYIFSGAHPLTMRARHQFLGVFFQDTRIVLLFGHVPYATTFLGAFLQETRATPFLGTFLQETRATPFLGVFFKKRARHHFWTRSFKKRERHHFWARSSRNACDTIFGRSLEMRV